MSDRARDLGRWSPLVAVTLVLGACSSGAPDDRTSTPTPSSTTSTAAAAAPPTTPPPPCPSPTIERSYAAVDDPTLDEISGAVVSPTRPELTWVHEDSGNEPVLSAIAADGTTVSRWTVLDVAPTDWEDMAAVADRSTLFVGDIGDNEAVRDEVVVLRIPEPDPFQGDGWVEPHTLIRLTLPEPANAEALLVDPRTGDIVIVTKAVSGRADVLVAPGAAWSHSDASLPMEHAGTLSLGLLAAVLAGDVSSDGDEIVLRTPTDLFWWPRLEGETVAGALLAREPCELPTVVDLLGEAVALHPDGGYLLLGEGAGSAVRTAR